MYVYKISWDSPISCPLDISLNSSLVFMLHVKYLRPPRFQNHLDSLKCHTFHFNGIHVWSYIKWLIRLMCNIYQRYISKVNQIYNLILWWILDYNQCIFTHILGSPIRVLYLNRYSFCYLSLPVTVLLSYRFFVFF